MDQILSLIPHKKSVKADEMERKKWFFCSGFWVSSNIKGKSNTGFQGNMSSFIEGWKKSHSLDYLLVKQKNIYLEDIIK